MNYKIGQALYQVYTGDEINNYKCELWTYIVRSERGGFFYAIYKTEFTWVKQSKKHGDWGWAKVIDPLYRDKTPVGEKFRDLHTTKLAAWKAAKVSYCTEEKCMPAIRRQITKCKSGAKK